MPWGEPWADRASSRPARGSCLQTCLFDPEGSELTRRGVTLTASSAVIRLRSVRSVNFGSAERLEHADAGSGHRLEEIVL